MQSVLVRLCDSGGRPLRDAKVGIEVHQFLAGGFKPNEYTNSDGEAEFDLDVDEGAEITVYVNGTDVVRRGRIQGSYRIQM